MAEAHKTPFNATNQTFADTLYILYSNALSTSPTEETLSKLKFLLNFLAVMKADGIINVENMRGFSQDSHAIAMFVHADLKHDQTFSPGQTGALAVMARIQALFAS